MPEAYEVGITLALQDGVSAGIQLIQRDLALLDRAIAATSQNLNALGGKAGGTKLAPAMQASPGSAADELSNTSKSGRSSSSEKAENGQDMGNGSASPTVAPAQAISVGPLTDAMARQADDAQSTAPAYSGPTQRAAAPVEQTGRTAAPNAPSPANPTSLEPAAAAPSGQAEATITPSRSAAPVETVQMPLPTDQQRRIGPVLPSQLPSRSQDDPAASVAPILARREPAPVTVSAAKSAAPMETVSNLDSRAAAKQGSDLDMAKPPFNRAGAPAPQGQSSILPAPPSTTSQAQARQPAASSPLRSLPNIMAPEAQEQRTTMPPSEPRRDGGQQSPGGAVAPAAATQQAITMQGDITIDGMRLGRWMTNAMARQASRPASGPVAPDPRQTPLWSGQAQGF